MCASDSLQVYQDGWVVTQPNCAIVHWISRHPNSDIYIYFFWTTVIAIYCQQWLTPVAIVYNGVTFAINGVYPQGPDLSRCSVLFGGVTIAFHLMRLLTMVIMSNRLTSGTPRLSILEWSRETIFQLSNRRYLFAIADKIRNELPVCQQSYGMLMKDIGQVVYLKWGASGWRIIVLHVCEFRILILVYQKLKRMDH